VSTNRGVGGVRKGWWWCRRPPLAETEIENGSAEMVFGGSREDRPAGEEPASETRSAAGVAGDQN